MTSPLVEPFPQVGPLMMHAYANLARVEQAKNLDDVRDLGPLDLLPRPWDVTTCRDAALRREVWDWLDAVVDWINTQHVWETGSLILGCWPQHPHLVHEIGCLADQRRRAAAGVNSEWLEDWHRYGLPQFLTRMQSRTRGMCEDGHKDPPGTARITRYRSAAAREARKALFQQDVQNATGTNRSPATGRPSLALINGLLVDRVTGEILP